MGTVPFKYNPGILGDDELVRSFVIRHKCLDLILETLRENVATVSSNRHLLVVGPRGIGKTMLVRRVAAEVRSNPEYGKAWFPIVYGEESYQVSSAGEFWLEALFHLSDQKTGPKLDATLDELREEYDDRRLRERALGQLLDFVDKQQKRLLLVVENLNMLCEQITPEAAWELRHTLTNEKRIMLLGTAVSRFETIDQADQAWFDLFAVHELKPIGRQESHALWRSVTNQDLKAGHVRAIRILTGGNPRLLTVLAGFAVDRSFRELMEQLVHLIDDHTEDFKGRLDALPAKERKVFVVLLEQWNPIGAADLARAARMGVNEVSALLSRLVQRGAVELFEERPRRKLYQASERLYNIYYLMRRRGQPADRVRAAVSFIVMFYGGRQLANTIADLAREACGLPTGKSDDHFVAYAELARRTPREVWSRALDQTPAEFFDREDAPEFIRRLPETQKVSAILSRATSLYRARRWGEAERALREIIALDPNLTSAWNNLGAVLQELRRLEEAEQAYRRSVELGPKRGVAWRNLGRVLVETDRDAEAEQAYRTALDLDPKDACAWHYLGRLLGKLGRTEEAERACLKAIECDSKHAAAWVDLGIALMGAGRLTEAEQDLRRAIEIDPKSEWAWANLGVALREQQRYEEAKQAYRTAIGINPGVSSFWGDLGHLLTEVGPPDESERVWEEALQRHPVLAPCAVHMLEARLKRGVPKDVILRQTEEWIEKGGRTGRVLAAMSHFVLRSNLTTALPLAEGWAREALAKEPETWTVEALALTLAAQGKWAEALQAGRLLLDAAADEKPAAESATDFLIQAAAVGYAKEAIEVLATSKGAGALEPLLVGLRIYLGGTPQVAKEILEVGQDVAERVREVARINERGQERGASDNGCVPKPRKTGIAKTAFKRL
jgi:tetratricopeptide (TPR) repeat protein